MGMSPACELHRDTQHPTALLLHSSFFESTGNPTARPWQVCGCSDRSVQMKLVPLKASPVRCYTFLFWIQELPYFRPGRDNRNHSAQPNHFKEEETEDQEAEHRGTPAPHPPPRHNYGVAEPVFMPAISKRRFKILSGLLKFLEMNTGRSYTKTSKNLARLRNNNKDIYCEALANPTDG